MDEYLSEKEQVERIREWWRDNGWFLLGGAVLGGLLLFGWHQYQDYRTRQAEQASALYQEIEQATDANKPADADALLARLRSDFPKSAYTDQAGLLIARTLVISAPDRAADELRYVMDHTNESEMGMIARLRLARVLAYRQKYDEALTLLSIDDPGTFAGRFNEVKGDIYAAQGKVDEARSAYLAALVADGSELLDRNFLQMKLNDLPQAAAQNAAQTSVPNAAATPAADAADATPAPAPASNPVQPPASNSAQKSGSDSGEPAASRPPGGAAGENE